MEYYYWGFPGYVTAGEERAKMQKKLAQLKKKNPKITPLVLQGTRLTCTTTSRVIDDLDAAEMFNIDIDEKIGSVKKRRHNQ